MGEGKLRKSENVVEEDVEEVADASYRSFNLGAFSLVPAFYLVKKLMVNFDFDEC